MVLLISHATLTNFEAAPPEAAIQAYLEVLNLSLDHLPLVALRSAFH